MFDLIKKYQVWGDEPLIAGFLRETSLEKITPAIGNNLIKVICGQRRCGKSFLKDNYRKIVVTLDPVSFGNRSGVEHFRAWEWIK